jgi:hypothetical protein
MALPLGDPQGGDLYFGDLPINFRFKPRGKFDKQSLLESIKRHAYGVNVDTETLVSLAVKWYSEGF